MIQLGSDPATTIARLGDGFYEQQLVREQIAELTGRRYLADHTWDGNQLIGRATTGASLTQQFGANASRAVADYAERQQQPINDAREADALRARPDRSEAEQRRNSTSCSPRRTASCAKRAWAMRQRARSPARWVWLPPRRSAQPSAAARAR